MPYRNCKICGKKFLAKPSWLKNGWGIYCSSECQYLGQRKGKFVKCAICGKEIWRKPLQLKRSKSNQYFCSKSCQTLWRNRIFKGINHPNWKNGENVEYRKILIDSNIKPICKLCGYSDIRALEVHHLDKIRSHNTVDNLVWLCRNCHHLVHCHNVKV